MGMKLIKAHRGAYGFPFQTIPYHLLAPDGGKHLSFQQLRGIQREMELSQGLYATYAEHMQNVYRLDLLVYGPFSNQLKVMGLLSPGISLYSLYSSLRTDSREHPQM